MSLLLLLEGIPGIRRAVFADANGVVLEAQHLLAEEAADVASVATVVTHHFANMGEALRFGGCDLIVVRSERSAHLLAPRRGSVATLELEPKRMVPAIEAKIRALDWVIKTSAPAAQAPALPAPTPRAPAQPPPVPTAVAGPATRKTGSSGFNGTFLTISVPDLLEYCRNSRRTGLLLCRSGDTTGTLKLSRGQIVDARSPRAKPMVDRLADGGTVSREQMRAIGVAKPEELEAGLLARRLVDNGLITHDVANALLFGQTLQAVDELVGWTDGSFEFRPLPESAENGDRPMQTDPQLVLMHLFKEQDEALQEWNAQVTSNSQK